MLYCRHLVRLVLAERVCVQGHGRLWCLNARQTRLCTLGVSSCSTQQRPPLPCSWLGTNEQTQLATSCCLRGSWSAPPTWSWVVTSNSHYSTMLVHKPNQTIRRPHLLTNVEFIWMYCYCTDTQGPPENLISTQLLSAIAASCAASPKHRQPSSSHLPSWEAANCAMISALQHWPPRRL